MPDDLYLTQAAIADSTTMLNRVTACAASEGEELPHGWANQQRWHWATQPGWAAAWDSALVAHPEPDYDPGEDQAVISDGMILSAVQSLRGGAG